MSGALFTDFLLQLRGQGLPVGLGEWDAFLRALRSGVIVDLDGLYRVGRAILCRSEAEFDRYDVAFAAAFRGAELPDDLRRKLEEWLERAADVAGRPPPEQPVDPSALWQELLDRLSKQKERHDGGNYWVGTRGTSPFGHSGEASRGIRIGGAGGRSGAVAVAQERRWEAYRDDRTLDVRDMHVALRALRHLQREGPMALDLDETIDATARNAGEIELVERRERKNQVHVVLLMDAGGSMTPHVDKVERLFTAASRVKTFKSFRSYTFHNCPYDRLWDERTEERVDTADVLGRLTHRHRLVFVGDASMAPYELFSPYGWPGREQLSGLDWLSRFHERCPAAIWLNPDPVRYWNHPTVSAIGRLFPMFELTVEGIRSAVRRLRAPF